MSFVHVRRHSVLSLILASLLFHHFVQTTVSQSPPTPPPSLTISKVQDALLSESIKYANMDLNPKLDGILQYFVSTPISENGGIDTLIRINTKNEVLVDVIGQTLTGTTLEAVLTKHGYKVSSCSMLACTMFLSVKQIENLSNTIPEVVKINLAMPVLKHKNQDTKVRHDEVQRHLRRQLQYRNLQGSVTSEAVHALYVDAARNRYSHINGTGITVGVMSDSFDCQGNQAQIDIQTGDLPPLARINVLADLTPSDGSCIDEGRAMMQLIYDIAPGVNFAFYTAFRSVVDFAAGIRALADAGCKIIVDDVGYLNEPFFQDGIISQAIDEVTSRGVSYFTAAGNLGNSAWDGKTGFQNSNLYAGTLGMFHSFGLDNDGNHILYQRFNIARTAGYVIFSFQWDEPLVSPARSGGSRSELDIYVLDENGSVISTQPFINIGSDPIDLILFDTFSAASSGTSGVLTLYIAILLKEGPAPTYMKIVSSNYGEFEFSNGYDSTGFGHESTATGASVGAAYFQDTPAYGVSPPIVEPFSSYGGTPTFFDKDGNRLSTPEIRQQPRFTGPDGIHTTFFYGSAKTFFGTSASAPNVAAVAALMLQLQAGGMTPKALFQILESTAIDMTSTVGFDFITGYGLVNASRALDAVSSSLPSKAPNAAPTHRPTVAPTRKPTIAPTEKPIVAPTRKPTVTPTQKPNVAPTSKPTVTPTQKPTIAPTLSPIADPGVCAVTWNIYNSKTDQFVEAILGNGETVKSPPPCGRINIEAVVPLCVSSSITKVTIELYQDSSSNKLIRREQETTPKYFLFGNSGSNVYNGKIKDGKYKIRAIVNGSIVTPFTTFALATGRCS